MYKVITPVAVEPITLAQARLQIKADDDVTVEDSLITAWITAAREVADQYTGRALAPQTLEMALPRFPACLNEGIDLDMPPVASITSIKYTDTAGVEQTISNTAYALSTYGDSRRVAPTYGNYWPTTQNIPDAVRIRYVTGYTAAPKAVCSALLLMVAWLNENRGNAMSPDDIQPPAAKALLNTVKIWGR